MRCLVIFLALGVSAGPAAAQIDPAPRRLLQLGFSRALDGRGPFSGYLYYYHNQPYSGGTRALRVAVAPVYADAELGFKSALGTRTDVGVGLAGGGYADSYTEIREGRYLRSESFTGDGVKASLAVYHGFGRFGPAPLAGILRGEGAYAEYRRDKDTAPNFALPNARTAFNVRAGLRWGGVEPVMLPRAAAELSVWYAGQFRSPSGSYGYAADRRVEPNSHLFWTRAVIVYNLPRAEHRFLAQIAGGGSRRVDRFSAFRLGGVLPLASEFPLSIPGYYYQEVSAAKFGLAGGSYLRPLSKDKKTWLASFTLATAVVDYAPGLEQSNKWHSGFGAGVSRVQKSWQALLEYGYGINAVRGHGNGAHTISLRVQFDLRAAASPLVVPRVAPVLDRVIEHLPVPERLKP